MFDPFNAHLPAGSGLALASVRRITEVHGGEIELRRAEGGRFRLELTFPSALSS
jgi:signal transduction histidine kinase